MTGEDSAVEVVESEDSLVPADDMPLEVSEGELAPVSVVEVLSLFCRTANSWLTRLSTEVTGG